MVFLLDFKDPSKRGLQLHILETLNVKENPVNGFLAVVAGRATPGGPAGVLVAVPLLGCLQRAQAHSTHTAALPRSPGLLLSVKMSSHRRVVAFCKDSH